MNGAFTASSNNLVSGEQTVNFPWSSYLLLAFTVDNFSNYGQSSVVLSSIFSGMSATRRVILVYGNDMLIEIYPNGTNSLTIKARGTIYSNITVKITGITKL